MAEDEGRVFVTGPDGRAEVRGEPSPADDLSQRALAEMSFSTHVVSLNAMALMNLGIIEGEAGVEPDLAAARHLVDTLAMLKVKTQGNLTDEEERLLSTVLYDLRVKYVQARDNK